MKGVCEGGEGGGGEGVGVGMFPTAPFRLQLVHLRFSEKLRPIPVSDTPLSTAFKHKKLMAYILPKTMHTGAARLGRRSLRMQCLHPARGGDT